MDEVERLKNILIKYMDHVGICEGVDFIAQHHRKYYDMHSETPWTDEEWSMLEAIGNGQEPK